MKYLLNQLEELIEIRSRERKRRSMSLLAENGFVGRFGKMLLQRNLV